MLKNKYLLIILAFFGILLIGFLLFGLGNKPPDKKSQETLSEKLNEKRWEETNKINTSTLVDPNALNQAKKDYNQQLEKEGIPTPTTGITQFDFILAPDLKKERSLIPFTYAQNTCIPNNEPSVIPIYTLKTDWTIKEAKQIASSFGIDTDPTSLPVSDGYQFYFSHPESKDFLTFFATSGMYTYHRVLKPEGITIPQQEADRIIQEEVKKHDLPSDLTLITSGYQEKQSVFSSVFDKPWPPYQVIDKDSISNLEANSICSIEKANTVNFVQVYLAVDGQLAKLVNQSRKLSQSYEAAREDLEEAVAEYKNNLPVEPIIMGKPTAQLGNSVLIDEAKIIFYDFGDIFSQKMYLPMYLTSGTVSLSNGTKTRVMTLFPAVSSKEMIRLKLIIPQANTLKLGSFSPPPTPPPTPTKKPAPTPGGPTKTPGNLQGCPGGKVDYTVHCEQNGTPACSEFAESPIDPWGVCDKGCIHQPPGTVTVSGTDPCQEFLNQQGISGFTMGKGSTKYEGTYSCTLNACPC